MNPMDSPLLAHLPSITPKPDLLDQVLKAIRQAQVRALRIRVSICLAALLAMIGYATINANSLWSELSSSSFIEFAKLTISDPDIMLLNSKDLLLGLLETVPLTSILISLASALCFFGSISLFQSLRHIKHLTRNQPSLFT